MGNGAVLNLQKLWGKGIKMNRNCKGGKGKKK